MTRKPSLLYRVLSALVGMVLAICFAAIALVASVWATAGNISYAEKILYKQDYFNEVAAAQLERSSEYFIQAGIMQQHLPGIMTPKAVENSMLYNLVAVYNGYHASLGLNAELDELHAAILQDFEAREIEITPELAQGVQAVINECAQSWLVVSTVPYSTLLTGLLASFATLRWWVLAVAGLLAVWCVWLLARLAGRDARRRTGAALFGGGLALAGLAGAALLTGMVDTLFLDFLLQTTVAVAFLEGVLQAVLLGGGLLCAAGVAVWVSLLVHPEKRPAPVRRAPHSVARHDEL